MLRNIFLYASIRHIFTGMCMALKLQHVCCCDLTFDGRGGNGSGTCQINEGIPMTGSSFEITGSGTDEGLSFTDDALTASPADAAVGVHDDGSGFHEDLQKTFF